MAIQSKQEEEEEKIEKDDERNALSLDISRKIDAIYNRPEVLP